MAYVNPEIKINETAIPEIDAGRLQADLLDAAGELTLKVSFASHEVPYACAHCGVEVNSDGEPEDPHPSYEHCAQHPDYNEDDETIPAPHVAKMVALGWLQYIKIDTDASKDEAVITIMIDHKPFIMSVVRLDENIPTNAGKLLISVPHPNKSGNSYTLTPPTAGHPGNGTYIIGDRTAA